MTGGQSTAGRNLIGVVAVCAVAWWLLFSPWTPLDADGWAWFRTHPGALGAVVVGVCALIVTTIVSGRAGFALVVALVLGIGAYAVPDVRSTLGHTERPFLASSQGSGR